MIEKTSPIKIVMTKVKLMVNRSGETLKGNIKEMTGDIR
ncbi:hypothetical protein RU86_GL000736 [Lactococcus piscium]|uniref:Uncharacterized protein n=1 Tax=Pseudolactococcus piscium TaxID=1364 RepID=A0A2A5RWF0_9LACT|nr:hypothetical protein RU86_GL000736 [Lactococcus piscium]